MRLSGELLCHTGATSLCGGGIGLGLALNCRGPMVSILDMTRNISKMGGFTLTEKLIVIVFVTLFATAELRALLAARHVGNGHGSQQNACINNLRIIDGAKGSWALELHKQITDIPTARDIQPYMGRGSDGQLPICPADPKHTFDTSYSMNNVGSKPTCKINPTLHSLP